jgi:O-antigen/teichoic acid export membrane protein
VIVSFVLPLGALLVAVGDRVLSIFGTSYGSHGYVLLLIIIAGALPDAATTLFVALLRVRRRLREAAALNTGIAAVTLILTWVLLPRFGITGAGVAWLIAQVAGTAVAASIGLTRHPVPAGTRKAAGRA